MIRSSTLPRKTSSRARPSRVGQQPGDVVHVAAQGAQLRSRPDLRAPETARLGPGEEARLAGAPQRGWVPLVAAGNRGGWTTLSAIAPRRGPQRPRIGQDAAVAEAPAGAQLGPVPTQAGFDPRNAGFDGPGIYLVEAVSDPNASPGEVAERLQATGLEVLALELSKQGGGVWQAIVRFVGRLAPVIGIALRNVVKTRAIDLTADLAQRFLRTMLSSGVVRGAQEQLTDLAARLFNAGATDLTNMVLAKLGQGG